MAIGSSTPNKMPMDIEWPARQPDRHAAVPLYARIKRPIKQQIRRREWLSGEKLPSENERVKQCRGSCMTVNRALRELTQEGLLSRARGLVTMTYPSNRDAFSMRYRPADFQLG